MSVKTLLLWLYLLVCFTAVLKTLSHVDAEYVSFIPHLLSSTPLLPLLSYLSMWRKAGEEVTGGKEITSMKTFVADYLLLRHQSRCWLLMK